MKFIQVFATLFLALFLLTACQEEKSKPTDELEEFVIQVEHSIEDGKVKQWGEVEQEFYQQWEEIKSSTNEAGDEMQSEMDQLKERFEKAKQNWESNHSNE
jgi:hypothetical protein